MLLRLLLFLRTDLGSTTFLVACWATLHPAFSFRPSVFLRSLASLLLPKCSIDLKYGPCPPAPCIRPFLVADTRLYKSHFGWSFRRSVGHKTLFRGFPLLPTRPRLMLTCIRPCSYSTHIKKCAITHTKMIGCIFFSFSFFFLFFFATAIMIANGESNIYNRVVTK